MKFRTTLPIQKYPIHITHKDKIMTMGSCFAKNISKKLIASKFNVNDNPFGIIYNPVSISKSLNDLLLNRKFSESDINSFQEKYFCYDFHGSFSSFAKEDLINNIQNSVDEASSLIDSLSFLIISLGSAYAFKLKSTGQIVANCHKTPNDQFERVLLEREEIEEKLKEQFAKLKERNKNLSIILTVSPVRHVRDGLIKNNLSKAVLIQAVHNLISGTEGIYYFPSYELLTDDLRDYRYYDRDLIHPSKMAVDYIWSYFGSAFFSSETIKMNEEIKKIMASLNHKAIFPNSSQHKKFNTDLRVKIESLQSNYPELDFNNEWTLLEKKIK